MSVNYHQLIPSFTFVCRHEIAYKQLVCRLVSSLTEVMELSVYQLSGYKFYRSQGIDCQQLITILKKNFLRYHFLTIDGWSANWSCCGRTRTFCKQKNHNKSQSSVVLFSGYKFSWSHGTVYQQSPVASLSGYIVWNIFKSNVQIWMHLSNP